MSFSIARFPLLCAAEGDDDDDDDDHYDDDEVTMITMRIMIITMMMMLRMLMLMMMMMMIRMMMIMMIICVVFRPVSGALWCGGGGQRDPGQPPLPPVLGGEPARPSRGGVVERLRPPAGSKPHG